MFPRVGSKSLMSSVCMSKSLVFKTISWLLLLQSIVVRILLEFRHLNENRQFLWSIWRLRIVYEHKRKRNLTDFPSMRLRCCFDCFDAYSIPFSDNFFPTAISRIGRSIILEKLSLFGHGLLLECYRNHLHCKVMTFKLNFWNLSWTYALKWLLKLNNIHLFGYLK